MRVARHAYPLARSPPPSHIHVHRRSTQANPLPPPPAPRWPAPPPTTHPLDHATTTPLSAHPAALQVCSWSYTFPVEGRPVAKDELRPLRLVMLVEAGRVAEARQMLDLVVGNMAAEAEEEEEAGPGPGPKGGPAGGRGRGGR